MQNNFKTRDFYLSAYLIINSCRLINCTNEGGLSTFEFEESEGLTVHLAGRIESKYSSSTILTPKTEVLNNGTNNKHGENN